METWQIATTIIVIYSILVIGIGIFAGRVLKRSMEDFYVLGRKGSTLVTFLATAATYHSAFAFLTSVAVFATAGITFWIVASAWTVLAGVFMYLVGPRIYRIGKARGHITPADMLSDFYDSKTLGLITAIVMALFIIAYIVVQAVGLGIILDVASQGHIPYQWASLVLILVAAIYLFLGGLRAAYWTDVLQGIWMYLGIFLAAALIVGKLVPGGFTALMDSVRAVNPKLLTMNWTPQKTLGAILIYGPGLMLLQHLWIKYYIAKDERSLKASAIGTAIYLSTYYIAAALIGLSAAVANVKGVPGVLQPGFISALKAQYGSADAVAAVMIYKLLNPVLAGFLLAGATAAAMSTLDSFLGSTSMILVRDIYQKYIKPDADEGHYIFVSRIFMIIWALIGWYFALLKPGLIFNIAAIACAGGLQFLPLVLQAVIPTTKKYINKNGAIWGLIVGSILAAFLSPQIGGKLHLPVLEHPAVAGLVGVIANVVIALIISALTKPSEKEIEIMEAYKKVLQA
ncbi:sodium:solute symporter family protein [Thermococcus paralvinellae]|uniref:Putative Na+/solute symporter n=1 Tax=Thermococcus paralvinellae TaxID=582419 RepID=W0I7V7_9EURY|nr:sodium:solute symporter family protein [Thermococcus paralvinellae]AHF80493.1 putative Na+/solute symporter [Thermococcus paralvinellae]